MLGTSTLVKLRPAVTEQVERLAPKGFWVQGTAGEMGAPRVVLKMPQAVLVDLAALSALHQHCVWV